MKRLLLLLGMVVAGMAVWADDEPKSISLTEQERELVNSNNDFAFNLIRKARSGSEDKSLVLSPLSITYTLSMVNNGAAVGSAARQEINQVLGFGDADAATVNALCHKLLTESGTLDELTKVQMANNIYVNSARGFRLQQPFVQTVQQYFDVTPETRDFTDGQTLDVINQWASDHTEGMIDKVMQEDEFDPQCISYLLNALYFKGEWTSKFDQEYTTLCNFGYEDKVCWLMMQNNDFMYTENNLYQAVILPYGNKAYQMTVFLPREGITLNQVLQQLNGQNWNADNYQARNVNLMLPRMDISTDMKLKEVMAALGLSAALGDGFTQFCETMEGEAYPVGISQMKQVAKLKQDEEGTEASAVTEVGMKDYGLPYAYFQANQPFLYVISERSTGSIFFIGQYTGDVLENQRKSINLTSEERQLVNNNNQFAINLMRQARKDNESIILSPLSITYALGMLNNGAAGQTQQEINQVLGFGEAGADAINQFCRKMLDGSDEVDKTTKVLLSNALFFNKDYQLNADFAQTAQQYYDAMVDVRDFYDGQTMNVINQWASDHTEGMIPKVLNEETFKPYYVSYLLNAIYFKGSWTDEFDPMETQSEPFNGGIEVPMMHRQAEMGYTENDTYQEIVLPYGNEAYQMFLFLPREGKTIADVLEKVNVQQPFCDSWRMVDVKLPRFEVESDVDLIEVMSVLGMPSAFSEQTAEFPYLCNTSTWIGLMRQSAKIKVNEKGTEAAAVTYIGSIPTCIPQFADFHADRPFLYLIRELSTGTIFFIGQYVGEPDVAGVESPTVHSHQPVADGPWYNLQGQRLNTLPAKGIVICDGKLVVVK